MSEEPPEDDLDEEEFIESSQYMNNTLPSHSFFDRQKLKIFKSLAFISHNHTTRPWLFIRGATLFGTL